MIQNPFEIVLGRMPQPVCSRQESTAAVARFTNRRIFGVFESYIILILLFNGRLSGLMLLSSLQIRGGNRLLLHTSKSFSRQSNNFLVRHIGTERHAACTERAVGRRHPVAAQAQQQSKKPSSEAVLTEATPRAAPPLRLASGGKKEGPSTDAALIFQRLQRVRTLLSLHIPAAATTAAPPQRLRHASIQLSA